MDRRPLAAALLLLLAGCAALPPPAPREPAAHQGLSERMAARCAADRDTPLLDESLAAAGASRTRLAIGKDDLQFSVFHVEGDLDDPHRVPLLDEMLSRPWRAGCLHDAVIVQADAAARSSSPGATLVELGSELLGRPLPPESDAATGDDFGAALAALCAPVQCTPGTGSLSADLAAALAPVLIATHEVAEARAARYRAAGLPESVYWYAETGQIYRSMFAATRYPPLAEPAVDTLLRGAAADTFHAAAARLIRAVESADLVRFAGLRGVVYDQPTPLGRIRVRDAQDHDHDETDGPYLLLLDLGGDDHYLGAAAATRPGNPVSVLVDLAGDDRYGYPESRQPPPAGLLADDGHGRRSDGLPQTLSDYSRQGAGRDGVALLLDLAGNDRYRSLAASQGYAQLGVGVLLDAAGDDHYEAELLAQGAAQFGIAVAADLGEGNDTRRAFSAAQGFGFVAGAGLLYDEGGNDRYECVPGAADDSGRLLYPSSQLPQRGNLSLCQGAGFGRRDGPGVVYRAGGVGLLRDRAGDDRYLASVYAQGVGYWQAVGLLADGAGEDRYDGDWYVQGAAAHYAVGMLVDTGGDDTYGETIAASNMHLGAGHDFASGVLLDERGDDRYRIARLGGGAANCSGRGLFVDNSGDDLYRSDSELVLGLGNVGEECLATRNEATSMGVMLDAAGKDRYRIPATTRARPANNTRFGHRGKELAVEFGVAADAEADSGIHAAPPAP